MSSKNLDELYRDYSQAEKELLDATFSCADEALMQLANDKVRKTKRLYEEKYQILKNGG